MTHKFYLGLDIGGTKSAIIVGDENGNVHHRQKWATATTPTPDAFIAHAIEIIREITTPIRSIGVSIGGPLNSIEGIIYSPPNLPGWDAIPLKTILQTGLNMPVNVMHDAAACALAEQRWGCPTATRLAYLTCGTGLGAGFVFDGKPYTGAGGRSPEVGHVRWRDAGPESFGKRGSVEAYGSGTGLKKLAIFLYPQRWPEGCEGSELSSLASSGDVDAKRVIATNAQSVGGTCAMLADTLALDRIVLGSLARYLGEPWLKEVRATFVSEVLPSIAATCAVEASILGERLQDCSSLAAAILA